MNSDVVQIGVFESNNEKNNYLIDLLNQQHKIQLKIKNISYSTPFNEGLEDIDLLLICVEKLTPAIRAFFVYLNSLHSGPGIVLITPLIFYNKNKQNLYDYFSPNIIFDFLIDEELSVETIGCFLDHIYERKILTSKNRQMEAQFKSILEGYDGLIYVCSKDYKIEYINQYGLKRTGYNPIGTYCYEALHERTEICPWCINEKIQQGETIHWELKSPKDNRWYNISNSPIYNSDGTISKMAMIEDIHEHKIKELELIHTKIMLEASNRTRQEFLRNITHELKTPLNSIIGFSELIENEMIGNVNIEQKKMLRDIRNSGSHLLKMIEDIIEISNIESNQMTIHKKPIEITLYLLDFFSNYQSLPISHGIKFSFNLANNLSQVDLDGAKFKQVIIHLLNNAISFTPKEGIIQISAFRSDRYFFLEIQDTGKGISEEKQAKLFEPFSQLEHYLSKKHQGLGLGLYLCRNIVEAHNGKLTIISQQGKGTLARIQIPLFSNMSKYISEKIIETETAVSKGENGIINGDSNGI